MRKAQIFTALLLSACAASTAGAKALGSAPQSRIVYRDAYGSVVITAPRGWAFDRADSSDPDLRAVLCPAGTTPTNARFAVYVKTVSKEGRPTLSRLIAGDIERRRALSSDLKVVAGDALPTARGPAASVRHFSGATGLESVAYLESPAVYVILVLSSKTEAAQKEGLLAFAELVNSYHFSTVTGGITKK
jgi:hypothetical protein